MIKAGWSPAVCDCRLFDYFAEVGNGERVRIRGRPLVAGERVGCF